MKVFMQWLGISVLASISTVCFANASPTHTKGITNVVNTKTMNEEKVPPYFGITAYKPNYALPYYYTGSPDNTVYLGSTPDDETLDHSELKFQVSLKAPIWENIFNYNSSLYFAYSQLSYYQIYNNERFFRENDYEPEAFLANKIDYAIGKNWYLNYFNIGLDHQSNGTGTDTQRGWDRIYLEAIVSNNNWMISLQPWYIVDTNSHNDDIGKYSGYGRALVTYKLQEHVFSFQARNVLEHQARYATGELTWSFPLTKYFKGYVQVFSGYGQSLIEYNHRTNSAGVGLALSDWV
jgi:phospholipase A1